MRVVKAKGMRWQDAVARPIVLVALPANASLSNDAVAVEDELAIFVLVARSRTITRQTQGVLPDALPAVRLIAEKGVTEAPAPDLDHHNAQLMVAGAVAVALARAVVHKEACVSTLALFVAERARALVGVLVASLGDNLAAQRDAIDLAVRIRSAISRIEANTIVVVKALRAHALHAEEPTIHHHGLANLVFPRAVLLSLRAHIPERARDAVQASKGGECHHREPHVFESVALPPSLSLLRTRVLVVVAALFGRYL
mmetsp:Transcript_13693/g.38573  ORF Transcript_13693/g.38573 Transcript_13693/m.38573 type:complete len:256 (+) Transcript_13693:1351-2118(+)